MKILHLLKTLLSNPTYVFGAILFVSTFSLTAAFVAEGLLGIEPCRLCIYQRYPFAFALALSLIGLVLRHKHKIVIPLLVLCTLFFFSNSAIATYHTGVQQEWWASAVEGCTVTFESETSTKSLLENIMSAPMGNCEDISWQDPFLGLSMANYNIILCFGMALFCLLAAIMIRTGRTSGAHPEQA